MERTRRGQPLGPGRIDKKQVEATTEAQVARYLAEDGFDADDPLGGFKQVLSIATVRDRTGLSQEELAAALHIPLATLRDWEEGRLMPDPTAMALFALVDDDPQRAFEVLAR